jgi:hypothetical protein
MHEWRQAFREGVRSGSAASALSTLALMALSRRQAGHMAAATNATSQWVWGDRALHQDDISWQHTVPGLLIHHAASIFWATLHARASASAQQTSWGKRPWVEGALVAATSCFADYQLTPKRLQPGFEQRLTRGALLLVYIAFGAGIALASGGLSRGESRTPRRPPGRSLRRAP